MSCFCSYEILNTHTSILARQAQIQEDNRLIASMIHKLEGVIMEKTKDIENVQQKNETMQSEYKNFVKNLYYKFAKQMPQSIDKEPNVSDTYDMSSIDVIDPRTIESEERQMKDFGEFNQKGVKLPYMSGNLQINFFTLNEKLWTEDLRNYVDDILKGKYIDVHMKISGAGKTAKLLALSTKMHMVYVTVSEGSTDTSGFVDSSFKAFVKNLKSLQEKGWAYLLLNVRKEILLFYYARFLHLYILASDSTSKNKELTPLEFIKHQFNGGLSLIVNIYDQVRKKCSIYSEEALRKLIEKILHELHNKHNIEKIAFALDEASIAATMFTRYNVYPMNLFNFHLLTHDFVKESTAHNRLRTTKRTSHIVSA